MIFFHQLLNNYKKSKLQYMNNNFKISLVITPHQWASLWCIAYENWYVTHPYDQILYCFENWDIQDLTLRRYDTMKTCRRNFFNFPQLIIIEKYVKIRFKNRGPPCNFLEVKRLKILQKLNKRDCFCNILSLIFSGVSRVKTDLHSKYIFNLVFGSFFE